MNAKSNTAPKELKFFVCEEDGLALFPSEKERDYFAKCLIQEYLQDGWDEGVEKITTGILTHTTKKTNVQYRKDQVFDEEGCDGEGVWWSDDWDYICNYELIALDSHQPEIIGEEG